VFFSPRSQAKSAHHRSASGKPSKAKSKHRRVNAVPSCHSPRSVILLHTAAFVYGILIELPSSGMHQCAVEYSETDA
jgi:hypothetical protein